MKRRDEKTGEESFADKMRERVTRGTDAARRMIDRVRELTTHPDEETPAPKSAAREKRAKPAETASKAPVAKTPPAPTAPARVTGSDESNEPVEIAPEFATATMGEILLRQGRVRESIAVFDALLRTNPGHAEAKAGLARARAALDPSAKPAETTASQNKPEPSTMLDRTPPPVHYHVSEARALPVDPNTIVVFWELTPDAIERAEREAGEGATRTLMIVSMHQGAGGIEQGERVVDGIATAGDYFVRDLPPGATHHAAVGLRNHGRFVAIVHAEAVSTPRGRPSAQVAQVQATLAVPPRVQGRAGDAPIVVNVHGPSEVRTAKTAIEPQGRDAGVSLEQVASTGPESWDEAPFEALTPEASMQIGRAHV